MQKEIITTNFKGVVDSTLREGLQFRETSFSLIEQIQVLTFLNDLGVKRAEVGNAISDDQSEIIKQLVAQEERPILISHIRNRVADLEAALLTGVEGVNILCCVDPERLAGMNKTLEQYINVLEEVILLAKENGLEVKVGIEDFFGQNHQTALDVLQIADGLGVDRVSIADTLGTAFPWQVEEQVTNLRQQVKADILVHLHNDLGMAQGNALVALLSGANYVDTTILGIGERTGINSLSVLLSSLYVLDNEKFTSDYHLPVLTVMDNWLANSLEIPVPFSMVTNQQTAFSHKAGIHLDAIKKHGPKKYEPFSPGVIGNRRNMVIGTNVSGGTTAGEVTQFYQQHGRF
jgi:homocitrate synthase